MKTLLTILAAVALLALPAKAQNSYAKSAVGSDLRDYVITAGATTNLTLSAFRLSAVAGGSSIIAIESQIKSATGGATGTNTVTASFATSIGDPTSGPWVTNLSLVLSGTTGTNYSPAVLTQTNIGPYQWIRPVKLVSTGTNNATVTIKLGQHRPF